MYTESGGPVFRAEHVHIKPLEYGVLGHYRTAVRILSTSAQVANSRIFEIKNNSTNLIIPTRLKLIALQVAAGTAQENSLDVFKVTGFTAVDTTNTVTPASSVMKTTGMAAYPGGAQVRHLTLAGQVNGMTGGTLTKDAQAIAKLPYNVAAAINTTTQWSLDVFDQRLGEHPLVLAQNEGLIIENAILNVTSFGVAWFIDFAWAEVDKF